MGVNFSSPFGLVCDLENGLDSFNQKGSDQSRSPSVKGGSVPSRPSQTQSRRFIQVPSEYECRSEESSSLLSCSGSLTGKIPSSPVSDPTSPKHEAAIKLQKVYKSFRTRRKLADCAVLIEQSWWKLIDFAELKHSSISFFDIQKHETAISRWSRARTRAAKVGKGLSKNGKAQKLALQHWLEAIDPRHRYGHNLHFYYVKWLNSQSREPFFYWLDIGEGKEVNLVEKCARSKLQQQCIKYLGPMERKAYEVGLEDGKLFYKETGELLDTASDQKGSKWIFVLSTSRTLYVGKKKRGLFQHSSFLSGGATLAAGRIVAEKGVLKAVWPHSGHYRPTPENFQDFISFLRENNVDLTDVKLDSIDDEDDKSFGKHIRNNSSEDDLLVTDHLDHEETDTINSTSKRVDSWEEENNTTVVKHPKLKTSKLAVLQIPSKDKLVENMKNEEVAVSSAGIFHLDSPLDSPSPITEHYPSSTSKLQEDMHEEHDESQEETITEDSILQRINSHKETTSYQLGKQLSCKWSTGAGPRIGCLRDYPTGLQSHALEQVHLSPKSKRRIRLDFLSRASTPVGSNLSRSNSRYLAHSSHL
ncbi:IQ domain-containing protein IQM2-like [Andrographis paniculata]|uniref:IQ domain-containing protein IQM2-like n=1 Tax=Andrographis paniculata TaxID=175694 RepID=UPI0021E8AF1D|nr:IQ domain-containing protein IQM2-like [Andrographis paniculata]